MTHLKDFFFLKSRGKNKSQKKTSHHVVISWGGVSMRSKNGWRIVLHLWITTHIFQQCSENKMEMQPYRRGLQGHLHMHTLYTCEYYSTIGSFAPRRQSTQVLEKHLFVLLVSPRCLIFLISRSACFCQTSLVCTALQEGNILIVQCQHILSCLQCMIWSSVWRQCI